MLSRPTFDICPLPEGGWLVTDPSHERGWRLDDAALAVLRAHQSGWEPGQDVPAPLQDAAAELGDPSPTLELLSAQGLLAPAPPGKGRLAVLAEVDCSSVSATVCRVLPWLLAASGLGLLFSSFAVARLLGELLQGLRSGAPMLVLGSLLSKIPHELGHAVALSALSRRPVRIGMRLRGPWPQVVTDVRILPALASRRDRAFVLLAGCAFEALAWSLGLFLALWLGAPRPWPFVLAIGGPLCCLFTLQPLLGSDGSLLLSEFAGIRALGRTARASALRTFFGSEPSTGWLSWYGLAELGLEAGLRLVCGLGAGLLLGAQWPGVVLGLCWAVAFLGRAARVAEP